MRKISLSAILLLTCAVPAVRALRAADTEDRKVYTPVPPEGEYYRLRNLMAQGVMPNYKALWYAFRHDDFSAMKTSLQYVAALCRDSAHYSPPEKSGNLDDFRRRMDELRGKVEGLSSDVGPAMDRSAVNDRILSIYQTCQSCHDTYAPAERRDARKYLPPR